MASATPSVAPSETAPTDNTSIDMIQEEKKSGLARIVSSRQEGRGFGEIDKKVDVQPESQGATPNSNSTIPNGGLMAWLFFCSYEFLVCYPQLRRI
jgi:hypothetical protein